MTITISTREYELSHGHTPRGFGGWWFQIGADKTADPFTAHGTYSECRKRALAAARERGETSVTVLP